MPVPVAGVSGAAGVSGPAGATAPVSPTAARTLAARLDKLIAAPGLGTVRTGVVVDVASGRLLYNHRATAVSTPASTTKLATAVAALSTLGPDHRLTTDVVTSATDPGRIVLVGGGDPTLVLDGLADDTATALKARGTTRVTLAYDTSFFAGPALHPIGPNDNLAPVTGLMVREGRLDRSSSGPAPRAADPARAAAVAFAQLLAKRGITVGGAPQPGSGAGGVRLAAHGSAPLSDLVEQMLTNSDNDLAEALARQAARALGLPANFAGGARAIRTVLTRDAVPLGGAVFTDGSGLNRADRLSPLTLSRILALAASPARPELRPIITGLPVAAFTGTLGARFRATPGAGLVHAKTGTLTGTNTIAGTTVTPAGRLLAFAFMTQDADDPAAAQMDLDALASALMT
ncbi:D-alanyl-D-alanine carboxypeptidase / D-alanyl-D-alanine-endopeptidase (penicillin-binding protein 4) [Streptomyces sp. DvalAA-14]|uniref:D-alanyl-D-alanine carboxypeptidase/D-alanyl-D-alanine endopeptidase n=1 Tax=unclassified Streptomyces TaxID=2593676 RepID=UPI00081B5EF9|nr:D-alanyl-D-alanine carboxypeptidase/D-alanyl-D-alanine-endopeptidase [Streptomyces sp. DvalAA-14]SCD72499.1 D-alanyl-D-alanine carboxypeptidase / D-alanyl-D-alanine-endopeptidase (penicillin-binding protein 4) [Streptomyces sp. DvalAA-14]